VRDLGDCRYRTLDWRDRAEPGLPRIVAAGPPLTVPLGHCHYLGGVADGPGGVRSQVAAHVERGVDVVKVMGTGGMVTPGTDIQATQFSPEELRLVCDLVHDAGLAVTTHAHGLAGQWHALEAGSDGIEHFSCLTDEGMLCPDELLAAVAEAGITVCPTLGFDVTRFPPLELVPPALKVLVERVGLGPERIREARAEQMTRVREHGIRVVTGVDGGAAPPKPHGWAWEAVLWLLDAGYSVAEALATATSIAAEACDLHLVTGRLLAGLDADLLVVDGDLESDPSALGRPVMVWARGIPARQ
jgi:imidazolonepropionase-like amidohydrolase